MVQPASDGRPLPRPNPTTEPFFAHAKQRELALPRCPRDGYFFYPRSRCPTCLQTDFVWETVSGRGSVYSFTVDRVGHDPSLAALMPLVVALIELDEGPRMTANVVDCAPEDVSVGMAVRAVFEDVDDLTLVRFALAEDG
jgi:uncharacterized OB-fold protein